MLKKEFILPGKVEISNDASNCPDQKPWIEIDKQHEELHNNELGILDLLGVYAYDGANNEGKIILYKYCIEEYASVFYSENSCFPKIGFTSFTDCVDLLYKIVFWHEQGHWITHWMLDSNEFRWDDRFWQLVPNPNNLLEGLAQAITYYFILNDADYKRLKFLFEYLLIDQPAPYHKHVDILRHPNFSWKNFFKALEQLRQEKIQDLNTYLNLLGTL